MNRTTCEDALQRFRCHLIGEELSHGTIEKYCRDVRRFLLWKGKRPVSRELALAWKQELVQAGYAPTTVNSMVVALNTFFRFCGWGDCCLKSLKIQRQTFRDQSRELTEDEYRRLVTCACKGGKTRLALLLETIAATGIRVSEVRYITVESANRGRVEISLKGKIRTILLPTKLSRKLVKYAKSKKITSGEIFLTRRGKGLSRKQIWSEMKQLCEESGVSEMKVFPHNLRHLFARVFYRVSRDLVKLADVLGHSNVETTRIYLLTTANEHISQLNRLKLVL